MGLAGCAGVFGFITPRPSYATAMIK